MDVLYFNALGFFHQKKRKVRLVLTSFFLLFLLLSPFDSLDMCHYPIRSCRSLSLATSFEVYSLGSQRSIVSSVEKSSPLLRQKCALRVVAGVFRPCKKSQYRAGGLWTNANPRKFSCTPRF